MTTLDCDQIRQWLNKGATLLDVRSADEHRQDALPDATHIPLPLLPVLAHERLDSRQPVLVYCRSGARAQMAMQLLNNLGFSNVTNIGGTIHYAHCQ